MFYMPGKSYRGELPAPDDTLVALANELGQDIRCLAVEIGERNVQHRPKQLAEAADYIETQFSRAGFLPQRQNYEVAGCHCSNLEVEIRGTTHPDEIVIIGAHYDTVVGSPGANDNASGVAAILALSRRLLTGKPDRTLRFVGFVNEELPYAGTGQMGSRVYARRCRERRENVASMMSLETIGHYDDRPGSQKYPPLLGWLYPSTGNFIGFIGNIASGGLVRQAVGTFRKSEKFPSEGAALSELIRRIGHSDHASFWREGYRALMVTDTADFRYPHYHTPEDTIDKVDLDRLARVVRGLEKVVRNLVGRE